MGRQTKLMAGQNTLLQLLLLLPAAADADAATAAAGFSSISYLFRTSPMPANFNESLLMPRGLKLPPEEHAH